MEEESDVLAEESLEDPIDQAFMRGYEEEEDHQECAECGEFIKGNPLKKTLDGEKYLFCCKDCCTDFEDGLG